MGKNPEEPMKGNSDRRPTVMDEFWADAINSSSVAHFRWRYAIPCRPVMDCKMNVLE